MIRRVALLALLAVLVACAAPGLALAATPRASLPDVEDEVMCTQCGTPLNVSEAPVADRERRLIQTLIDQGRTKAQIKTALVEEYGPRVLAEPSRGGFEDAAFLVPVGLGLLAVAGVGFAAWRWRRARGPEDNADDAPLPAEPAGSEADRRRLDAELAAFDS